ncbi:hypothetical protein WR25_13998 [Diploscapter pachys]|uniref:PNPLA domain-containing protein n=1 Tax=Diploscapter pachys TaxID=2018661 RepID=A0A2A2KVU5_9BILA|nr:hypothetical protein WR25_13998 [Diploscapter pachys]
MIDDPSSESTDVNLNEKNLDGNATIALPPDSESSVNDDNVDVKDREVAGTEEKKEKMLRPLIAKVPVKEAADVCLSFSGCGFLGSYHFGVVSCLLKNGQPLVSKVSRVSGASAGSLVASLFLLVPDKLNDGLNILYEMADELNSLRLGAMTPGYYLNEKLIKVVDGFLPEDITPLQERLHISVTDHKTRKNKLLTSFTDRKCLIDCLMSSCYIPIYSMGFKGEPPCIDGCHYIDGGYSNNLPDFEDMRTVTVSPFTSVADICPSDDKAFFEWNMTVGSQHVSVNMSNIVRGAQALFPPKRAILQDYYLAGYKHAFRYLQANEMLKRPEGTSI